MSIHGEQESIIDQKILALVVLLNLLNQSSIDFGSAFKHKEFGTELSILSIYYKLDLVEMGLGRACPWNNVYLVLNLKVRLNTLAQFGISFKGLPLGLFGLRGMISCLTISNGLNTMLSPFCGARWIGLEGGFA